MANPTKNLITRELVEKELRVLNRKDIRWALALFLGTAPFSLLLATGLALRILSLELLSSLTVQTLIAIFVWCFVASPFLLLASVVFHALSERRLLKKGRFEVSVLPLSYKQEQSVHRHLEEQLVFRGFHPFAADSVIYLMTDAGEKCYLVHYPGKKDIKLVYPLSMYDYKDENP